MQLQGELKRFTDAGIGVAAMTYDRPELQKAFIDKYSITFPLMSDIDATSMKNLGILNEQYDPGDSAYGIPHPGVFVLDTNGRVVGKIFLEAYSTRVDADGVLRYAQQVLAGEKDD